MYRFTFVKVDSLPQVKLQFNMKYSVGSHTCNEVPTLALLYNIRQTNPMFS